MIRHLTPLLEYTGERLLAERYEKYRKIGVFEEIESDQESTGE